MPDWVELRSYDDQGSLNCSNAHAIASYGMCQGA
jgi:hypothetical protein